MKVAVFFKDNLFRRYFFNSSWMLVEQLLRVLSGFFVGIYIARYLGPDEYGVLSYVLAIATFIIAISRLGMDAILIREVLEAPDKKQKLIGTAFWMMLSAALLCCGVVGAVVWSSGEVLSVKIYSSIISVSTVFTSFMVVDFYFQSQLKAKYSAICKSFVLFFMSLVKLFLIFVQAELIWFVLAFLLDYALLGIVLVVAAGRGGCIDFIRYFSWQDAGHMLRSALPLMLGAVAIQVYMRIDQVMIRNMLGLQEVGLYSAAVRVYEGWAVIIGIVTVSLLPAMVKLKQGDESEYHRRLVQLFRVVVWMSVLCAIAVCVLSEHLMVLAFGVEYQASAPVVDIVMWTAVFAAMGSVSARYFNVEKMEGKFALRTTLAAVLNICLNYFLIPVYGIRGAAVSTLICTIFANYVMDWFDPDLKSLLRIKHKAIFGYQFA